MFAPMIRNVFSALAVPIETNDEQALRDKQMLQRQYFQFIATIVANNVTDVFQSQEPAVLQHMMQSVIQGSVDFPDPVVS